MSEEAMSAMDRAMDAVERDDLLEDGLICRGRSFRSHAEARAAAQALHA